MTKIAIVIPAAGASRRMRGQDKLLQPVDGVPLLVGVVDRASKVSPAVLVTVPDLSSPRAAMLAERGVSVVDVPDASEGMSASLRAASKNVPGDCAGVMILPADMPDITADDLRAMCAAFSEHKGAAIVQATGGDGTPGHPVIFPSDLIPEFANLTGDAGARSILRANRSRVRYVALPDRHALTDLDSPEAWEAWRAANPDR